MSAARTRAVARALPTLEISFLPRSNATSSRTASNRSMTGAPGRATRSPTTSTRSARLARTLAPSTVTS